MIGSVDMVGENVVDGDGVGGVGGGGESAILGERVLSNLDT